jgi:hypothetical protein
MMGAIFWIYLVLLLVHARVAAGMASKSFGETSRRHQKHVERGVYSSGSSKKESQSQIERINPTPRLIV